MDGDSGGPDLPVDGEQVSHLKRGPGGAAYRDMDVHDVIEAQRTPVLDNELEDGEVDSIGTNLLVGITGVPQQRDAGFFEIGGVCTVVNDPHCVRFSEAGPDAMSERIVVGS